jgi:RNA recognition motif-containing protein
MRLYVGNLAPETTREELLEAFRAHGEVGSVDLPAEGMKDGTAKGLRRGYGFVVMASRKAASAAIAGLDGKQLRGNTISVRVAIPKWSPQYIR